MSRVPITTVRVAIAAILGALPVVAGELELREGDVVAFTGGTDMVRAQKAGHLEALLTRRFAAVRPRFRDLAWEGDTVFFQSTVHERWREDAFGHWAEQLERVGATVVIAQYGKMESLAGEAGLERFATAYRALLDRFEKRARRIVLVSPTPFVRGGDPGLPDLLTRNRDLARYVESIREIAVERGHLFVDLLDRPAIRDDAASDNGVHLTDDAHATFAAAVATSLGAAAGLDVDLDRLRRAVVEKHRLWYDSWRPANWKCLFGDDGERIFGRAAGGHPSFRDEWRTFPGLIERAEERVWAVASGSEANAVTTAPVARRWRAPLTAEARAALEREQRAFDLADGLAINLFASEGDGIVNPLAIRWDPRGRLFVACSIVYPQLEPGKSPDDTIIVLEDTDGDGASDRSTLFARGLNIPTGMEVGAGGVWVGQGTELLFLADTDGDGRADRRDVVLSGFGNGDSHQTINSFVWSPGGELFFCQGDGIESRVETPWGISTLRQAGVFALRPRRLELDGLLDDFMGPGNPWGVAFDDWGQAFVIDGAGGISFLTPALIPTRHVLKLPQIGKPGGYCGVDILGGRHLPESLRGDFVIGDYKRNLIGRFAVRPDGAGFDVVWKDPLLRSSTRNFRPIDVRMGPDGAVYIADWHNPIICHQDDSYRHPDRDRTHGRIWRVTGMDRPPLERPRLAGASTGELLELLRSPERWTRYQAKRALVEREPSSVARALSRWVADLDPQSPNHDHLLVEALGVAESIESVQPDLLARVLGATDHRARAYAARVGGRWQDRLPDPLALLAGPVADAHPLVRMEAVLACGRIASPRAVEVAARVVDRPRDRWIEYAFTQAVRHLEPHWLPELTAGRVRFDGDTRRTAAVLEKVRSKELLASWRRLARDRELEPGARRAILAGLVAVGTDDDLRLALDPATYRDGSGEYDGRTHGDVLADLFDVCARSGERPRGDLAAPLEWLLARPDDTLRVRAIELTGLWKVDDLRERVSEAATDGAASLDVRRAAIAALARFGERERLAQLTSPDEPPAIRIAAIESLCLADPEFAASRAVALLDDTSTDVEPGAVVRAFLAREKGARALASALADASLSTATAGRCLQAMSAAGREDAELVAVFNRALGLTGEVPEHSAELVDRLVEEAMRDGDPASGELVYRSATTSCSTCHAIGGAGGWIGPDLGAAGTTIPIARIVEEVVWPERQVKEGYALVQVIEKSGAIHRGYAERSGDDGEDLLLRDLSTGSFRRIPRRWILHLQEGGTAMPSNLVANLTRAELRDLIRFVAALGTPGPFAVDRRDAVRTWQFIDAPPGAALPPPDAAWHTVHSRVSGALELDDLPRGDRTRVVFLRATVETPRSSRSRLRLDDVTGLRLWIDGATRQPVRRQMVFDLEAGAHELMIRIDRRARAGNSLLCEWGAAGVE